MEIFPSRTDWDRRASPVRVASRQIEPGIAEQAPGFSASLAGACGPRLREVDCFLDRITHCRRESRTRAFVEPQRPEFLFDLHNAEASGRRAGNGGGDARHGPLDQMLPAVVDGGTPGDPAFGLGFEEIGMACDQSILPTSVCFIAGHHQLPRNDI
jgi:hypothetical protein